MLLIPGRVAERAYRNYLCSSSGCHISTYSVQSSGYAQVGWSDSGKARATTAHRAAWVYMNGQVPDGMDVDHTNACDKRCVNVDHLRLLTIAQNRRRQGRGYPVGFCNRGHADSNRIQNHRGAWICPACKKEQTHESAVRVRARRMGVAV